MYCRAQGGDAYPRGDGSATVPILAGVTLIAAAIVILCREVIVKVAVAHVVPIVGGLLSSATSEGGEGEAIEVGLCVVHVDSIDARHCHSTELVTVYPLS